MKNWKPYILVIISILIWAGTPVVSKKLLETINNYQILFYASGIASLALFVVVVIQGKLSLIKKYRIIDYWRFFLLGFLGVYCNYYLLYTSFSRVVTTQETYIVYYTWPIWVVVMAFVILRERFAFKNLIAILLGFIGVVVVVSRNGRFTLLYEDILSYLMAVGAAVCYSLFSVLSKKFDYDRTTSMFFAYIFSFILISVTTMVVSYIPFVGVGELVGLMWLGVFTYSIAFISWLLALKNGATEKVSNLIFFTPFVSLIYISFFLGEKITIFSVVGLCLIVVGIILQKMFKCEV